MNRLFKILLLILLSNSFPAFTVPPVLAGSHAPTAILHSGNNVMPADSINYPPILVDSFSLPILSPAAGVQFYKDGILFLSSSKLQKKMIPEHLTFGNMEGYYAVLEDTAIGKAQLFSPDFPFSYPGEAVSFSRDYSSMYFTKYSEGLLKIHQAINTLTYRKSGWLQSQNPLAFCEGNYNYAHPALSHEGKFMVLSSDKDPSSGGMDLFITYLEGESWTDPKALTGEINTPGDELFPYVDKENNLYFSSNGHPGNGGYDIYMSRFNGESWEKPVSLPKSINSENDELAFRMNFEGSQAFYTSGKTGQGDRQLYRLSYLDADYDMNKYFLSGGLLKESESLENLPFAEIVRQEPEKQKELAKVEEIKKPVEKKKPATRKQKVTRSKESSPETPETPETIGTPVTPTPVTPTPETPETSETSETPETIVTPETIEPPATKESIIYRVQFASSSQAKGSYTIKVNSKDYKTWEYYYKGAYRSTVGEFASLSEAAAFQNLCRKSGFSQAFVAAFKDDVRSLDPELFR